MAFVNNPFLKKYKRIISVVPSQTELLATLGVENVVGITKFCVHPKEWRSSKKIVGGTKNLNLKMIRDLKPDLIIANKEENNKEQIEQISQFCDCYLSEIVDLSSALQMIRDVGCLCGKENESQNLANLINDEFLKISVNRDQKTAIYLIWKDPYMTVGQGTFINNMLHYCGLKNSIQSYRYPEIDVKQIIELKPEFLLLSSEPYPFKEKHIHELQDSLPDTKVILVNGEYFSWYGSRLLNAPRYFQSLSLF